MSTKKSLGFGKMLALLLLIGFSAVAKTISAGSQFQEKSSILFSKTEHSFHKNMLQPQIVHVSMMPEHSVKPSHSGYVLLSYSGNTALLLHPATQSRTILQDLNRCESVSRLLFPFHNFW